MKARYFFLLLAFVSFQVQAQSTMACPPNTMRTWNQSTGYSCVPRFSIVSEGCFGPSPFPNWFQNFPPAIYQPRPLPWWAAQGNLYYPNMHYPGPWYHQGYYPGINPHYYPGQGEVFAAKPNVYVESVHTDKKFSFSFTSKEELSFLATTPVLDDKNTWSGKILGDQFEVDDVRYDYLFYDIRLPKKKMQFERGVCAIREEAIKWMLNDLKEMQYPIISLQDFEEHWKVKIPDYPIYCIYPQYNQQLDSALPVNISVEQTRFVRSLYVLVPYKEEPDIEKQGPIPLPSLDPQEIRPKVLIKHENMFKEWGVAFLGE